MADQSLGTIAALVRLNLTQLGVDVQIAKGLLGELGASMQQHAANIAQQAGVAMAATGAAITAVLGETVKAGADWNQELLHISGNTSMTQQQTEEMRKSVESIGSTTAASLSSLAQGYMHVSNFAFQGAAATKVLAEATKYAVATGDDASKVAEVLAGTLHNFGMSAEQAGGTMNLLHTAAARANSTLGDFASAAGPAFAAAHAYHLSIAEAAAAIQVFTQHQFSASEGTTLFANIVEHVANPTRITKKALEDLGLQHSQLAKDMTFTGLSARGLVGFLKDLEDAAKKTGKSGEELAKDLFRGKLGGTGTAILVQNLKEYAKAAKELQEIFEKGAAGIWQFAAANTSLAGQIEIVKNNFTILAGKIEKDLLPVINSIMTGVKNLVQWFDGLPAPVRQATVIFTALAGIVLTLVGVAALAASAFASLSAAAVAAGFTLGAIGAAMLPIIGYAAAVAAAIALLVVAWNSDFLRIRSIITGFIDWVRPFVEVAWYSTVAYLRDLWNAMVAAARGAFFAVQVAVRGVMDSIVRTVQQGVNLAVSALSMLAPGVAGTVRAIGAVIPGGLASGMNAIANNIDDHVRALGIVRDSAMLAVNAMTNANGAFARSGGAPGGAPGGVALPSPGGGSRGGRGGGGAADALRDIQARAEEARKAIEDCNNEIFRLTHNEWQVKQRDVLKELEDRIKSGVPVMLAQNEAVLKMAEIATDHAKQMREEAAKVAPALNLLAQAWSGIGRVINGAVIGAREFAEKMAQLAPMATAAGAAIRDLGAALHMAALEQGRKAFGGAMAGLTGGADLGGTIAGFGSWMAKMRAQAEEIARVRAETNRADYEDYLKVLLLKIQATTIYTEEWKRLYGEIGKVLESSTKKAAEQTQKELTGWQRVLRSMADQMTGVFTNAFEDLFKHGWGKFFSDVLQGFTQMLEKMVAELLAKSVIFGIFSLFGGGDLLGSFGSFLGFDDWGNDRKAQHWGFDYADHFTRGMQAFSDQRTPAGGTNRGQTIVHAPVTVHATINHEMDINDVSRKIAWNVQQKMLGYVT